MSDDSVYIKAHVVRVQGDVLSVRLADGFAQAEVPVHREFIHTTSPDIFISQDDLVRLPLTMALEMTRNLRANANK